MSAGLAWTWALVHSLWELAIVAIALSFARVLTHRPVHRYAAGCIALVAALALPPITFLHLSAPHFGNGSVLAEASRLGGWIPIAWSLGVVLTSIRIAAGLCRIRQIVRGAQPLSSEWRVRFERVAQRLAVDRPIRWLATNAVSVPMTVGTLRPVILLPISVISGMAPSALDLIVAHELAHVRRFDYLVNLAQSLLEAFYFFHPAVWWISARVREDREPCCDDIVVLLYPDRLAYARALTRLEECHQVSGELMLASSGGALMARVERLFEMRKHTTHATAWLVGAVLALAIVAAGAWTQSAFAGKPGEAEVAIRWLPGAIAQHRSLIEETARRYGLDPNLLAIVVLVESGGDTAAMSPSGARGLMQVMPKTAQEIARERNIAYREELLDDPAYNLDLGAFYLRKQLSAFDRAANPLEVAVAAYNGGETQIRTWLSGQGPLSEETAHYKALVTGLLDESQNESSPRYDAWRAPTRAKIASRAMSPVASAKVSLSYGIDSPLVQSSCHLHPGVDLAAPVGTPVKSSLDGVVETVTENPTDGRVVVVRHNGGFQTRYHHLGSVAVTEAEKLSQGAVLGTVGMTGYTTGPHVHFEVRDLGEPIDPAAFLRLP